MIRCGAFCFSPDREKAEEAVRSARKLVVAGTKVRAFEAADADLPGGKLVALTYAGEDLPMVHGWLSDHGGMGEFSMLSEKDDGLEASRDYCGTRALYFGSSKKWIASDHRFFRDEPREPVPQGGSFSTADGKITIHHPRPTRIRGSFEDAAKELAGLVNESVKARAAGKRRVAVAFSGGLDSSILAHCAAQYSKVIACSISAQGSTDSKVARDTASSMDVEFATMRADEKKVKTELRDLDLPFEPSPMDKSLWCIYSMTARLAYESDAEVVMLGQLADELFGGYAKYEAASRRGGETEAERMMSEDVAQCGVRGFIRDEAASRRWCEPRFPFAERGIAMLGQGLPVSFKIRDGVRKAVLREAAIALGLPPEIAMRPKKAAQYSSGVMKLLG